MAEQLARIQLLIDNTANWERANPILLSGEVGFEIKTNRNIGIKVGDGMTAWNLLDYTSFTPAEITAMQEELQAEIDAITVSGTDGSSEVAQARVAADGMTYATLKARLDANDNVVSGKMGGFDYYIMNDELVPDYMFDVTDIPNNCTVVFGTNVSNSRVKNLPEYGVSAIYITKFYSCDFYNQALNYYIAFSTGGKFWFACVSIGGQFVWHRIHSHGLADHLGIDNNSVVTQDGVDYWCHKGYGVYLNDMSYSKLNITSLMDIPKNTTIAINGSVAGMSESNVSGLPVYNKNLTIMRVSALSHSTGDELDRKKRTATGILDMFVAMWEENGKAVMKYCFAKTSTATTPWVAVLTEYDKSSSDNFNINLYNGITMFEKIGVIGDSISCGWAINKNGNKSRRNLGISWVQQMARQIGCTAYNLGASGVSATTWFAETAEEWNDPDSGYDYCYKQYKTTEECDLYIIGLGLNGGTLGSLEDVKTDYTQNGETFYGQYARIIQMINHDHPNAIVMCFTEPTPQITTYDQAVRDICNSGKVNALLVDLERDYFYLFNTDEIKAQYQSDNLHFKPYGYSLLATAIINAINDYISKNSDKFHYVGVK